MNDLRPVDTYQFEIKHSSAWPALRADWARLHAADRRSTFFLSPLWVDTWLSVFGNDLHIEFACFCSNGATEGIALIASNKKKGPLAIKKYFLNTAGEQRGSPMLEHNALLCRPELLDSFAGALSEYADTLNWDEWVFNGVRASDMELLCERFKGAPDLQWQPAPFVDLEVLRNSNASFLASLSSNTRQKIRRSIKLYEQQAELNVSFARDQEEALTYFAELMRLHQALWQARDKTGAFSDPAFLSFHEAIIKAGTPSTDYDVIRVSCGEATIGVVYNLIFNGHISYYQSGFEYQSDNRIKPGLVCHSLVVQYALDQGYKEYDLLATANGGSQYKTSLANAERLLAWASYRRISPKFKLAQALKRAKAAVRGK